jgi:MarR family transcriptional regulator, transcriptional regulator for hemolysin
MKSDRIAMEAIFGREILPLARRWRAEADRAVADLGLSHASGWALLQVGRLGDAVRQSDLAAELDMQGPSLVRLIDKLEADALIARRLDEADRRVNRIHLTEAGAALVDRIEQALRRIRHEMLDGIDDDALNVATRVLLRISQRIAERRGQAR